MSLLGIDLGTSSVKVALTDSTGTALAQADAEYPITRRHAGWAETDPQAWWQATASAISQVIADHPPDTVATIGLSGQMHGVVLCAADGVPVRPAILWADTRAEAQLAAYRRLPPTVRQRLANPLSPGMAGPVLGWLHANEPDAVAAARFALQPKDWLRARLTGSFAAEPSDASATLLYDVLARSWDDAVVDALGIRRALLPDLLPFSGAVAGHLQPGPAAELSLTAGVPVAAGAADTAAAALGSGLLDVGTVQLTIGTGVQIVTPVPAPTAHSLAGAPAVTHLYRSATRHGWYSMAAGLTGGQTLNWVRTVLGVDWSQLYAAAARRAQPEDPTFLPHLIGERTPYMDVHMRGAWVGLNARHDREALLYAALEGVAFAVADGFDALPALNPDTDPQVRLAGGGTVAAPWRALLADVLNVPLHPVQVPGASVRGAALLAAQAAGQLSETDLPDVARPHHDLTVAPGAGVDILRERRATYRKALVRLHPATATASIGP